MSVGTSVPCRLILLTWRLLPVRPRNWASNPCGTPNTLFYRYTARAPSLPPGAPSPTPTATLRILLIALARASGVTSKIKLGTGIVLVPEHNPLVLAKEIAALDQYSGGRFLFGIGGRMAQGGNHHHGRRLRAPLDPDP